MLYPSHATRAPAWHAGAQMQRTRRRLQWAQRSVASRQHRCDDDGQLKVTVTPSQTERERGNTAGGDSSSPSCPPFRPQPSRCSSPRPRQPIRVSAPRKHPHIGPPLQSHPPIRPDRRPRIPRNQQRSIALARCNHSRIVSTIRHPKHQEPRPSHGRITHRL